VLNDLSADIRHATLPNPHQFGDHAPGLRFLEDLFDRVRDMLTLSLQIFVLIYVISTKNNPDGLIVTYLVTFFFGVLFFMPTNGFGGAGWDHTVLLDLAQLL
jgi:hypothetical protein